MPEETVIEVRLRFDKSKGNEEAKAFMWLAAIPPRNRNYVVTQHVLKFLKVKDMVVDKLIDQSE